MSLEMTDHTDDVNENAVTAPSFQARCMMECERAEAEARGRDAVVIPDTARLPVKDLEYKAECSVIPQNLINELTVPDLETLPRFIEGIFPPKEKPEQKDPVVCLAVLPFNGGLMGKESMEIEGTWKNFLAGKQFLRALSYDPETQLTTNVAGIAGHFYELLCERLKKDISEGGCSFTVKYPDKIGSTENKIWFLEQYAKALENLKAFFNEPLRIENKEQLN